MALRNPSTNDKKVLYKLGYAVRLLRSRGKLSLRQLSDKSGVSHTSILKIERGETEPGFLSAYKVAKALDIDLGDL